VFLTSGKGLEQQETSTDFSFPIEKKIIICKRDETGIDFVVKNSIGVCIRYFIAFLLAARVIS